MPLMKVVAAGLLWFVTTGQRVPTISAEEIDDPCRNALSNADMRECYWKAQTHINAEADSVVNEVTADLRKSAQEFQEQGAEVYPGDMPCTRRQNLAFGRSYWS